jgi:hypothetical protein
MLGAWNGLRCSVPCQVWRTNRSPQLRHGAARVKKWRELWARKRESWCENNKKTQQRPSHIFPSLGPYLLSSLSLSLSLHCCGLPIGKCCRRLGSPALRAVGLIGFATTELPLRLAGARPCCTNLGFLPATQRYVLLRDPTSMQVQARKDSRALGD